jgi:hypothetical protein
MGDELKARHGLHFMLLYRNMFNVQLMHTIEFLNYYACRVYFMVQIKDKKL